MQYDFTSHMDRKGQDSMAVDALEKEGFLPEGTTRPEFDRIPMWVADMNFPVVPTIVDAIVKRAQHPAYGYFLPRQEYFDSIIAWHNREHGTQGLAPHHISYQNGVLGGLLSALRTMTSRGDNVLVHAPTYIGFTNVLKNNGYNMILSHLYVDDNGVYRMDFDDMEQKIIKHKIHATIFCSPHNPTGRVWEQAELEQAMALFEKHNVMIIADEIWSDLILYGNNHIVTQAVSEYAKNHTVGLFAPSKTFNLAGLIGAYSIIYNDTLRSRVQKESSLSEYNNMNVLSQHALIGAYQDEGVEWRNQLCNVFEANIDYARNFIHDNFPGVFVGKPEATYMLLLDCTEWCKTNNVPIKELQRRGIEYGVIWQDGERFNLPNSIRINLALPLDRVKEAFARLREHVFVA